MLKRNHLLIHARAEKHYFITVTESWLNTQDKHSITEAAINGYNIIEKYHLHKAGGGVLLRVKSRINVMKFNKADANSYDSLYVEIEKKKKKYILGVVYRPKQSEENDIMLYGEINSVINNPSVNCELLWSIARDAN